MKGIPADWQSEFTQRGFGPREVDRLVRLAYTPAHGTVYPKASALFRAFELCPLDSVRVVILGQDPYYAHPGQADGLAFSVPEFTPPASRSIQMPTALDSVLRNLTRTSASDPTFPFTPSRRTDLSGWAAKGVLLVNTALTVQAGSPGSHSDLWSEFTHSAIDVINSGREPVAFMLWGGKAHQRARGLRAPHETFLMPHPAYRPRKGERNVWRSGPKKPFADVNAFLEGTRGSPIDWSLS